jgi:outer membrane biosynthesis protein TonB
MRRPKRTPAVFALLASLLLHVPAAIWFVRSTFLRDRPPPLPVRIELLTVRTPSDAPPDEPEPTPPPPPEEHDGQIVEIARPEHEVKPEEAKYLAEYDSAVPEETQDKRFRADRQVTAETYSPIDRVRIEDQRVDVESDTASTGADAGRLKFRDGSFSLFSERASRWRFDTSPGVEDPVPAQHLKQEISGSPSNDFLPDVASADRTALNAHEFLFAAFWNRVKRLVSFYADQTLANAQPSVPMTRLRYEIVLKGLIALDGTMHALELEQGCGIPEFDEALREAFALAAPFPDPPSAAADDDGFIHMRDFHFIIDITPARAELSGIDPRSTVQFPGLQTIPR